MLSATLALVLAAAPAPFQQDYRMTLGGVPVGAAHLGLAADPKGGFAFEYRSATLVRRGPVLTKNTSVATCRLDASLAIVGLTAVRTEGGLEVRKVKGARASDQSLQLSVSTSGGPALTTKLAAALVPSALAFWKLDEAVACVSAVDESNGKPSEVCGARVADSVKGTVDGEPFEATFAGGKLVRLSFPRQTALFEATATPPDVSAPPDLFGTGVPTTGLPDGRELTSLTAALTVPAPKLSDSTAQTVTAAKDGVTVKWTRALPKRAAPLPAPKLRGDALDRPAVESAGEASDAWDAARRLAAFVEQHVTVKQPMAGEQAPAAVWREARGSCVGHTALFLALASRAGLEARGAVGLVANGGRFWAHEWAQVKVGDDWFDVDPTEGAAPARSPRILFSTFSPGDEASAGSALLAVRKLKGIAVTSSR